VPNRALKNVTLDMCWFVEQSSKYAGISECTDLFTRQVNIVSLENVLLLPVGKYVAWPFKGS
jgi:hypothetical protein